MAFLVSVDVDNPDGYPDEFAQIVTGAAHTKREKRVLVSHRRAVRKAKAEILSKLQGQGLTVEEIVTDTNNASDR